MGGGKGTLQEISKEKECFFSFLIYNTETRSTLSESYNYDKAFGSIDMLIKIVNDEKMNCIFLGKSDDRFHFAIYY